MENSYCYLVRITLLKQKACINQDCYRMGPVPGIPGIPGVPGSVPGMLEHQGGPHYGRGGMINPQHHLEMNGSPAGGSMIPGIY